VLPSVSGALDLFSQVEESLELSSDLVDLSRSRMADWPLVRLYKLHMLFTMQSFALSAQGSDMLGWLGRWRENAVGIEAEAEAVMRAYAVRAYAEARRRERDARSRVESQNWSRVALVIAERTCKRVGFDTSTRMASDANFASSLDSSASPPHAAIRELDPLDELSRLISEDTGRGQYRIQFLGAGTDQRPTILAEVEVRASEVSTAMGEVVRTSWPPRAVGFRLVDLIGAKSSDDSKAIAAPGESWSAIARRHWLAAACN
jgi:hypothetical protein